MDVIRVAGLAGVASVQDLGRPGRRHAGIPPGGTLVPDALVAANRACGNPDDAAGIEWIGRLTLELPDGREIRFDAGAHVSVLVFPGGVRTPVIAGSRGASWSAGLGRPLATGDALPVGRAEPTRAPTPVDRPVRLCRGPDVTTEAWEALLAAPWQVLPASDRVGTRLSGSILGCPTRERSTPMTRGAVQLLPDGGIVVLGPDHPITGGYPVIAVIVGADVGVVGRCVPGARIGFVAG